MNTTKQNRTLLNRLAAFCVCAGLLLCAAPALAEGTEPTAAPAVTAQEAMAAYAAVLLDNQPYVQTGDGAGETTFSAQPASWYGYELGGAYTFSRFCVTDLDADGLPEIILDLPDTEGSTFGYELLRCEAGTVYGFAFGLRSMEEITREGDIATSSGAFDNGWYTLRFSADQVEYVETCRMQSTGGTVQYFIGEDEVTRDTYLTYINQLEEKEQPMWLEFTEENVRYVVSQFNQQ